MFEFGDTAEKKEIKDRVENLTTENFKYKVGLFATKCAIAAAVFVPAGTYVGKRIVEHGSQHVADDLKPTINDNGNSLQKKISEEIDPTKKDLQDFTGKGDKFFNDYEEFKVAVCKAGTIKLESCPEILAKADENLYIDKAEPLQASGVPQPTQSLPTIPPMLATP